jgi:osmotically-inducible protein OsmY
MSLTVPAHRAAEPARATHDAEVQSEAQNLLERSNYLALRRLRCEFHDGRLVLNGRVPTYYLKQVAQTIVRQLPGVRRIDNMVDVAEFWN